MSNRTLVSAVSVGLFLLSLPFTAAAAVSFQGGWEDGVVTGPGSWYNKQAVGAYSLQIVSDVVRAGSKAMRVEVRPGDNPLNCCFSSERAEVTIMTNPDGSDLQEGPSSGTQYYGFSVRLEPNFQFPLWSVVFQLHGPDYLDVFPLISVGLDSGGFYLDHYGGNVANTTRLHRALGPVTAGVWTDFILKITYATGATGEVMVWRRNEGEQNFTQVATLSDVPTLQYIGSDPVGEHYWKTGYYRSKEDFTSVIWNDNVVRADTYEEVVDFLGTVTPPPPPPPPADTIAPTVPTSFAATAASYSAINLSWVASTDAVGVAGYKIYRDGTQIADVTSTTYTDTNLTAGVTYIYRVAAYDAAGNMSVQSSVASATTQVVQFSSTIEAEDFQTKSSGSKVGAVWNLNSNGYISHPITVPVASTYTFDIIARGTKAAGEWANMRVSIDNVVKSNVRVNSTLLKTYRVTVTNVTAGEHILKLEFTNDYYNAKKKEDRNLLIDKVTIKNSSATSMVSRFMLAIADTLAVAGIQLTAIISVAADLLDSLWVVEASTQSV
jgi:hypothetical protein